MARAGQGGLHLALLTGSQLQPAHVTNYSCGIKCLLCMIARERKSDATLFTCSLQYSIYKKTVTFSDEVLPHICKDLPSTCFWQSSSWFGHWQIHGCSYPTLCLQRSWSTKHIHVQVSFVKFPVSHLVVYVPIKAKYLFELPICSFKATVHPKRKSMLSSIPTFVPKWYFLSTFWLLRRYSR